MTADELGRLAEAVLSPLELLWARLVAFLPNVLAAFALLLIGYVLARSLRYLLENVLRRVGIDRFSERVGVDDFIKRVVDGLTLSRLLGWLVFWFVMLAFFISAADALQLPRFSSALDEIVRYLPNVAGAIAILLVGLYFAGVLRDMVTRAATMLGTEYANTLGTVLFLLVAVIGGSLAVSQLNVETALLNQVVVIVLVGAVLALALAVGLGGRDVASNALAGIYLRELLRPDDEIQHGDARGHLISVTAVTTLVAADDGTTLSIPNRALLNSLIRFRQS